jgi:hypothetical protein
MMQHPFIDQMVADQRIQEQRRRGDAARIARSVKPGQAGDGHWARARLALPEWRRAVPKIRLHRTRPLVVRHRPAG